MRGAGSAPPSAERWRLHAACVPAAQRPQPARALGSQLFMCTSLWPGCCLVRRQEVRGSPVSQASGAALGRRPRTRQLTTRPFFLRYFACYNLWQTAVKIAMLVGARASARTRTSLLGARGPPSAEPWLSSCRAVEANEAPSRRCRADCRGAVEALSLSSLSSSCRAPVELLCVE
jgi:hypothetical protein